MLRNSYNLQVAEELSKVSGVQKVLLADNEVFNGFLPEALTPLVLETQKQFNFSHIFGGSSAMTKVHGSYLSIYIESRVQVFVQHGSLGAIEEKV